MAKQVKNSDLVQGQLWQSTVKETEAFIVVLNKLEQSFKDVSKASAQSSKNADTSSAKGIKIVDEELQKQKATRIELDKVQAQIAKAEAQRTRAATAAAKQRSSQEEKANNKRQKAATDLIKQRKAAEAATKKEAAQVIRLAKQKEREAIATAKATAKTLEGNRAYNKASAELNTLRKRFKDLAISGKGTRTEMAALLFRINKLRSGIERVDRTVGQSQRNVGNYSSAFKGLGQGIGSAIGPFVGITAAIAGVTAGLRAATGLFREFGLVSAKVQAVSGATASEFEALQTQAKELGRVTPFTATNVAELQLELSKLGLTADQIGDSTGGILDFAIATDSALGEAGKTVAATINAFDLLASDSGNIADVLTKAFSSSALDLGKFDTALGIVGATANLAGLSLEETTAVLGTLVDAGIDASTAATGLRKVLAISANENRNYKDVLAEIVGDTNQLSKANEIFGLTAQSQAATIANNIDKVDGLTESLKNAGGASKAAADIIGDTLDGDLKRLTSAIQGATLGNEGFEEALRKIIQFLTKAVPPVFEFFTKLVEIFIELFKPLANGIELIVDGLSSLREAFGITDSAVNDSAKGFRFLNDPLEKTLLFLRLITRANELVGKSIREELKKPIDTLVKALFPALRNGKNLEKQLNATGDAASDFGKTLTRDATAELEKYNKFVAQASKATSRLKNAFLSITASLGFDKLAKDALDLINKIKKEFTIQEIIEDIKKQDLTVRELTASISTLNEELKDTNNSNDAGRIQGIIKLLEQQRDAILNVKEAAVDNKALGDAELEVEKNFQDKKLQLLSQSDEKILEAKNNVILDDIERQKESIRLQEELQNDLNNAEIERLEQLIKARGEIIIKDDAEQIKLRQELQQKLTELTIEGLDERGEAQTSFNESQQELEEQRLKDIAELEKKIQDGTIASIDVIDQAFAKSSQNRLDEIDREKAALKDREDALRQAAQNGSELAKDNLATNQRLQAEQERVRDEQVKKAQRRELILAGLKAFAENAGEPGAVGKTLRDITTLSAALINLNPFFHGTDDTGKGGSVSDSYGPVTGYTHQDEMVLSKADRGDIGFDKTRVDIKDAFAFQEMHRFDQAPIVQVQRFESNTEVLQKFDVLAEKLDNLPDRMPRILDEKFDEKSKVYTTVVKTGNKIEKNHKKIGSIWG